MLDESEPITEIKKFLAALSPLDRNEALTYYGQPNHSSLVFDWHYGLSKLKKANGIFVSDFSTIPAKDSDKFIKVLKDRVTISNASKAFCNITIPPSGRNPFAGGHSVALVIDKERKQLVYQDPWGDGSTTLFGFRVAR